MRVTLRRIRKIFPKNTITELKDFIQSCKKKGIVFVPENIDELRWDDSFDFYYFLSPGRDSGVNSFPIPITKFHFHKDEVKQLLLIKGYFENYYCKEINDLYFFKRYDYIHPFVGIQFIWISQKKLQNVHSITNSDCFEGRTI